MNMFSVYNFKKSLLGQLLSLSVGLSFIAQEKIIRNNPDIHFFLLYSGVYLLILCIAIIGLIYKTCTQKSKNKHKKVLKGWQYIKIYCLMLFSGTIDYLAGVFLNMAFQRTNTAFLILLTQLIYPMSIFADKFFYKTNHLGYKKMFAFSFLAVACYIINRFCGETQFEYYFVDVLLVILSNILYMMDSFLQFYTLRFIDCREYLIGFSTNGFLIGLIIANIKMTPTKFFESLNFLKEDTIYFIMYWIAMSICYTGGSPFIENYGATSFNGSLITSSAYYGVYHIFNDFKNESLWLTILFIICIMADVYLICKENRPIKNNPHISNKL